MKVLTSKDPDSTRVVLILNRDFPLKTNFFAVLTTPDNREEFYFYTDKPFLPTGAYAEDTKSKLSKTIRRDGNSFIFFLPKDSTGKYRLDFHIKEPSKKEEIFSESFTL